MITKNRVKLKIGVRYWLDSAMDVSGVFQGKDKYGLKFNQIEGDTLYIPSDDGFIRFRVAYNFFEA